MTRRVRATVAAAIISSWVMVVAHATTRGQQTPAPPVSAGPTSVLDGVYTPEQAKRGLAVYTETCERCHGKSLEGNNEGATPLTGPEFTSAWGRSTVGALFNRIRTSMPDDDPGSVSPEDAAAAIAYILSYNKYPEGKTELPHESEPLKKIKFEAIK
jgi:cytochrome c5